MKNLHRIAVLLALALVAVACGGGEEAADDPTDGQPEEAASASGTTADLDNGAGGSDGPPAGDPIAVHLQADPETLDPHTARTGYALQMSPFLYDTLTHRVDGEVVPGLATEWEVEADRVVFTVRDDVTCADGTRVTSSVIQASFERLVDPETAAPYATKELGYSDPTFIADDEAGTFTIELPGPFSDLLHNSSHPSTAVICPSGLEDPAALSETPDGSGPFVLEEAVRGDHYTLTARESYSWGPSGTTTGGPSFPTQATVRIVENQTTAANLLLSGELDVAILDGSERQRVADSGDMYVDERLAYLETLMFNHAEGRPTADPAVREAISSAIDREAYTEVRTQGFGEVTPSYLSEQSACFEPADAAIPDFDVEQVQQILTDAGYEQGEEGVFAKDGEPLQLRLVQTNQAPAASELLRELLTAMGVDVVLEQQEPAAWQETVFGTGAWDMTVVPFGDHSTPSSFHAYFSGETPPGGSNFSAITNAEYAELADEALTTTGEERCPLWHEAELALLEQSDVLPLSTVPNAAIGNGVEFRRIQYNLYDPTSFHHVDG